MTYEEICLQLAERGRTRIKEVNKQIKYDMLEAAAAGPVDKETELRIRLSAVKQMLEN